MPPGSVVQDPGKESRFDRFRPYVASWGPWVVYALFGVVCAAYLNYRADLIPKVGTWYQANPITLELRAFMEGRLAILPHPTPHDSFDYDWGRGGMHSAWGLGVPFLALPFHLLARLFGAPAFPDSVRFLIEYVVATVILARALHRSSRDPNALVVGSAAAAFVVAGPTYVGMIAARWKFYEETIAVAVLWDVVLLAGVLAVARECTPRRLALVCAAAGFTVLLRPPTGIYGVTTVGVALLIAYQRGLRLRALVVAAAAFAFVAGLYPLGNLLRYGSPFVAGFENGLSGAQVNRLVRWGLPFAKTVPLSTALKEMFATAFLLKPTATQVMWSAPPPEIAPYAVGERWREYYCPTYNLWVFAAWMAAIAIVAARVVRGRLWRRDRDVGADLVTTVGLWAIPPSIALFYFYTRISNLVTRYLVDIYPAYAAVGLCVGMAMVGWVRKRSPAHVPSVQLALAGVVALYMATDRGWVQHLWHPIDRAELEGFFERMKHASVATAGVPNHFEAGGPRGPQPIETDFDTWQADGTFSSGMVFAMPHATCVAFAFTAKDGSWGPEEDESVAALRVNGDFDAMKSCGAPIVDGSLHRVTMCEPRQPTFLLDGLRLYALATLAPDLTPIDRLKLMRIESKTSCP